MSTTMEMGLWRGRDGGGSGWSLSRHEDGFLFVDRHGELRLPAQAASRIVVTRKWWRTRVAIAGSPVQGHDNLRGLSGRQGRELARVVRSALLEAAVAWCDTMDESIRRAKRDLVWIPEQTVSALVRDRPDTSTISPAAARGEREQEALLRDTSHVRLLIHAANEETATKSLEMHRSFFDTVEASPLTEEQARAVVAYDNRVNVIAAAGSGKTSVMVARAAYAIKRGFARPEEILLLAFNTDAAAELQQRLQGRLAAASIQAEGLRATTFHAFGLSVIGQATGRKPSVAPWVANGGDIEEMADIVAELRDNDAAFGRDWDIFRLLYARAGEDPAQDVEPDAWDRSRRFAGLRTFKGDVVRSHGERLIADWLFLHGVSYEYERPYVHDTVDASHGQYTPDFFYPHIDVWHEHWGVDDEGRPPSEWSGYEAGMAWKRQLHREHGTTLLETTWSGVMAGADLDKLGQQLSDRGVQLNWDPHRAKGSVSKPMTDADLLRLIRTFMTHVKSNSISREGLGARLQTGWLRNVQRAQWFLRVYWQVHDAWESRLAEAGYLDFEDMLVQAAAHIEAGRYRSPYNLVMVDEFQDVSQSRAKLARGLVGAPGKHLMVVGDDWQSINRFAGADLSVVTHFQEFFGPGPTLHLTATFRSHPAIADAASRFISKNPAQQDKRVVSVHDRRLDPAAHEGVRLRGVTSSEAILPEITTFLAELDYAIRKGVVSTRKGHWVTVDVLGRYRHERKFVPSSAPRGIRLQFRTVHSAKGLEADYVVVPNMSAGTYGFPSEIVDDPVLSLAMTHPDDYPHAEERRLFYVALTRARRGVLLIAPADNPSPFVTELVKDDLVQMAGGQTPPRPCPECGTGILRQRTGRYGPFWGCGSFPRCTYTAQST